MKIFWFIALFAVAVSTAFVLAGQMGLLKGTAPTNLGVHDSRLKPPSQTPNSVSSQADLYPDHPQKNYARIAPFLFTGDADKAMAKIAGILRNSEQTVVVLQEAGYLYAQSSTPVLKFTDDVEFWLDRPAGVIHARSSSRLGRNDFNVNRTRLEAIRAQFTKN